MSQQLGEKDSHMAMQFENKVTTGTLWTIFATVVSVVIGAVWGWNQMQAQIEKVADRVGTVEETIRERRVSTEASLTGLETRTRMLEVQGAGFGSDLRNIQDGVNDIKEAITNLADQRSKP